MKDATKHYKRLKNWSGVVSLALNVAPVAFFAVSSMKMATPSQRVSIAFLGLAALVVGVVNILMKIHPRSLFWMVLLGLYWVLGDILPVLCSMAGCCFLDEVVATPLHKYATGKYSLNKEIDKRNG